MIEITILAIGIEYDNYFQGLQREIGIPTIEIISPDVH